MDDKAFLQYALKQSFAQPTINSADGVLWDKAASSGDEYLFFDTRRTDLLPFVLPLENLQKYHHAIAHDIRNCPDLYREYDMYKHDLSENITIPENIPEIAAARQQLDMITVNRQSAQKKKIVATLVPTKFITKIKAIRQDYQNSRLKIQDILNSHPEAVNLSILDDFCRLYLQITEKFKWYHPFWRSHKKNLNYYLNEAAQIMKSHYPLPNDFFATRTFAGENGLFRRKSALVCTLKLRQMVILLQKIADEPQLLTLAQTLLVSHDKYNRDLVQYRNDKKIDNTTAISSLRHSEQILFEKFAYISYLDGVRFAFEHKYLNESPQPRHPALPTVSPLNELKMVAKIVSESRTIVTAGKIAQIYNQALAEYDKIRQITDKYLKS